MLSRHKVTNFQQKFDRQSHIYDKVNWGCSKISILPYNISKMRGFSPNLAFLDNNFPTRKRFSNSFPTANNLGLAICPPHLPRCHWWNNLHHMANTTINMLVILRENSPLTASSKSFNCVKMGLPHCPFFTKRSAVHLHTPRLQKTPSSRQRLPGNRQAPSRRPSEPTITATHHHHSNDCHDDRKKQRRSL